MLVYLAGEREVAKATSGEAEGSNPLWLKYAKRRLFSYYYHGFSKGNVPSEDSKNSHALGLDLFLDSGAFTAFTKNKEIALDGYAEYIKAIPGMWTACSSLDVIGSGDEAAEASYQNFRALIELGVDVKPVWHVREPDRHLARLVNEKWPYIFIGGMVPESVPWLMQRLDGVWSTILATKDGRAKCKTHGFGLTDSKLMFRYPWFSVDSTSWLMKGVYGLVLFRLPSGRLQSVVFSEDSTEARKFKGWHYFNLTAAEKRQVEGWLEPYGVTPQQLATHYSFRDAVNAATYQNLEDLGTDRFVLEQETLF